MATCLSQLYHELHRGVSAGYAKFETFPIWNIPLNHPVNVAYEAATADLDDVNMIDPFHLEAYGEQAVNYNRDISVFPVLKAILQKIAAFNNSNIEIYKSPTDMGVNMVGYCIEDDAAVCEASKQEIIRRYLEGLCLKKQGLVSNKAISKLELLMNKLSISVSDRKIIEVAKERSKEMNDLPAVSIQLPNGEIVAGGTSDLLTGASAALLNALKALGKIDHEIKLISQNVLQPISDLKQNHLGIANPRLRPNEVLIALSLSKVTNPIAEKAMEFISELRGSEGHSTVILPQQDQNIYRKLGINLTCDPQFEGNHLFQ